VLGTYVTAEHVEISVSKEGEVRAQAVFLIRNKTEQFLEFILPEGYDKKDVAVYVNGKQLQRFSLTKDGRISVSLAKAPRGERTFPVQINYMLKGAGALGTAGTAEALSPNLAKAGIPVDTLTMRMYLPKDYTYTGFGGNMRPLWRHRKIWEKIKRVFFPRETFGRTDAEVIQIANNVLSHAKDTDTIKKKWKETFVFVKEGRAGGASVSYMKPVLFYFLDIVFFFAAMAGLYVLHRKNVLARTPLAFAFAVGTLTLATVTSGALESFFSCAFLGTLAISVIWAAQWGIILVVNRPRPQPAAARAAAPQEEKPATEQDEKKGEK
jgi:hypothetical protein